MVRVRNRAKERQSKGQRKSAEGWGKKQREPGRNKQREGGWSDEGGRLNRKKSIEDSEQRRRRTVRDLSAKQGAEGREKNADRVCDLSAKTRGCKQRREEEIEGETHTHTHTHSKGKTEERGEKDADHTRCPFDKPNGLP